MVMAIIGSLLLLVSCGVPNRTEVTRVKNCMVVNDPFNLSVVCPDGTTEVVDKPINGKDGKDGKDGRDGIDGKDGRDGVDGKDGVNGSNGTDGVDGEPCTVYEVDRRTVRIECPDGSSVDIKIPTKKRKGRK